MTREQARQYKREINAFINGARIQIQNSYEQGPMFIDCTNPTFVGKHTYYVIHPEDDHKYTKKGNLKKKFKKKPELTPGEQLAKVENGTWVEIETDYGHYVFLQNGNYTTLSKQEEGYIEIRQGHIQHAVPFGLYDVKSFKIVDEIYVLRACLKHPNKESSNDVLILEHE